MQDKYFIVFILVVFLFLFTLTEHKAQNNDPLYNVNFNLGLGPSIYLTDMDYENFYGNYPFVFTFRIMWEPEHLLKLGVESGYLPLFYLETKFFDTVFGTTNAELSLNSIPVMAVFSMEFAENFELIGGVGGFILISEVTSFDNYVLSWSWSNAYELGVSYLHPISANLKVGGEIKTYYISRLENYDLVFNVSLKYSLFSF